MRAPLIRGTGMKALPSPRRGGDIRVLRKEFINLRGGAAEVLFCGMMTAILNPFGNHLTQILCGPPGSGKTTAIRLMRCLTDPNKNDTRQLALVRDLMHGAANTHVIALENVSEISDDLSDTICRLNTGLSYSERLCSRNRVVDLCKASSHHQRHSTQFSGTLRPSRPHSYVHLRLPWRQGTER